MLAVRKVAHSNQCPTPIIQPFKCATVRNNNTMCSIANGSPHEQCDQKKNRQMSIKVAQK